MSNTVHATVDSQVFHATPECCGLKRAKNEVHAMRQSDAERYFRKNPCYICYPRVTK